MLVIAGEDKGLIESQMVYKLSPENRIKDPSWIHPGKVAWDWWNANNLFGVDFKALRFTMIYGLGKSLGSTAACSLLIEKAARDESVMVDFPDAVLDWVYIKDVVNSLILAREAADCRHRVYNIGGGSHSVRQVIEIVKKSIPDARIEIEAKRTFPWPPSYDYSRASDELGYKPLYTIEKGISDFISEVRKQKA